MQTAVEEAQPSLFTFRLTKPKRFPARLSFFAQDIVESLIKEPQSAEDIAAAFGWQYDAVIGQIRTLSDLGLLVAVHGDADGDVGCLDSADCYATEVDEGEPERGDICKNCGGTVSDVCRWRYFGGPISEFYKYITTKGVRDGIQS